MKNYYGLYPGPKGLEVDYLGKHEDFELACVADAFNERAQEREPSLWIANDEDLVSLTKSMRKEYKGE